MAQKILTYSAGTLYNDRRIFYPSPQKFARLYSSANPFISTIFARGAERVPDKDYKMFEHRAGWRYQYFYANGAPNAWNADGTPGGTTTVTVDNITGLTSGNTATTALIGKTVEIWNSTNTTYKGHALITAVPSTTTLTLKSLGKRDHATFTNSAIADNDIFYIVGTAYGEGSEAPEAESDELQVVWNSVQRFKTSVEISRDLQNASLRGASNELARLRDLKAQEHKMQMERAFLFGMRSSGIGGVAYNAGGGTDSTFHDTVTDADGKYVTTTMGVITALQRYGNSSGDQQNLFTINGAAYAYEDFVLDTEKVFQYGDSDVRDCFCGPRAMSFWAAKIQSNSGWEVRLHDFTISKIGFSYRTLETPHGMFRLIPMPIFRSTPYNAAMVCVSSENLMRKMYDRAEYRTNIKVDNAPDLIKDVYQNWEGLGMTLMEKHSYWNITNY